MPSLVVTSPVVRKIFYISHEKNQCVEKDFKDLKSHPVAKFGNIAPLETVCDNKDPVAINMPDVEHKLHLYSVVHSQP